MIATATISDRFGSAVDGQHAEVRVSKTRDERVRSVLQAADGTVVTVEMFPEDAMSLADELIMCAEPIMSRERAA